MNKRSVRQYLIIVSVLSLAIAIILKFPSVMDMIFSEEGDRHRKTAGQISLEALIAFIVAFVMFIMNYFILKPFDKERRLRFQNIALSVVLTILSVEILNHLLFDLSHVFNFLPSGHGHKGESDITNFFISVLVIVCVFVIRLVNQKQSYELENEKLRSESLQSQFESLKSRVSPHFLFNSMTAVKTLINESPGLAAKYVDHLSQVLRYTLQSNEKQLVTLSEELEFTDSYIFLVKKRYEDNLIIKMDIDEDQKYLMLPPLTLQTLVENAIKHNEISKRNPLTILIFTGKDHTLTVSNRVQQKLTPEEGTGIGLSNLSKQYLLLGTSPVQIFRENNEFRVVVPLIKL